MTSKLTGLTGRLTDRKLYLTAFIYKLTDGKMKNEQDPDQTLPSS
ncbi:MAG TPA: hypothetical protein VN704_04435 [Verrucomicrobiae bacterium]|nr:hypothetical protein [Verrucomicrobiae bacterium]